jgi:hypothetical protein
MLSIDQANPPIPKLGPRGTSAFLRVANPRGVADTGGFPPFPLRLPQHAW